MAQTAAVKQSKANARAQKQLGHNTWRKAFMQHYWLYIMMLPALLYMIIFNYLPMTGLYRHLPISALSTVTRFWNLCSAAPLSG